MPLDYPRSLIAPTALLVLTLALGGCASQSLPLSSKFESDGYTNPSLSAKIYTTDGALMRKLQVSRMSLGVTLMPGFAETKAKFVFLNPTDEELEGELQFDLPAGALLTGYSLDIEDVTLPGVLVPKPVARKIYQARVRAGIDPGIAEQTSKNSFRTTVYPIPENGTRTITFSFISPISDNRNYQLRLLNELAIDEFELQVRQLGSPKYPRVDLPTRQAVASSKRGGLTKVKGSQITFDGNLVIKASELPNQMIQAQANGELFAFISAPHSKTTPISPASLRVYWDKSLSNKAGYEAELAVVEKLIDKLPDTEIELVDFTHAGVIARHTLTTGSTGIPGSRFNGGSGMAELFASEEEAAAVELCLLISDGRINLGGLPNRQLPCPLVVVSASPHMDQGLLSVVAKNNNGRFVDLSPLTLREAVGKILRFGQAINAIVVNGSDQTDNAEWTDDGTELRIVVPVSQSDSSIELSRQGTTESYSLENAYVGQSLGSWWTHQRLVTLRANDVTLDDRIEFARRYPVASQDSTFAVFEELDDYLRHDLPIPKLTADEHELLGWEDIEEQREEYRDEKQELEDERLGDVIELWQEQIDWYETDFVALARKKSAADKNDAENASDQADEIHDLSYEEIIVTARKRGRSGPVAQVQVTAWSPDRPYLTATKNLCGKGFESAFFQLLPQYETVSTYFLDMADKAFDCQNHKLAREIALSALESPLADRDTKVAVAHRLQTYGELDLAIDLFHQLVHFDSRRPQPWRDIALAYAARARLTNRTLEQRLNDYQYALESLHQIVIKPWSADYDGADMVALMDANLLISEAQKLGDIQHPFDPQLVRLLAVDLRVIVTWNADIVDLDLAVMDPDSALVNYRNTLSPTGGRISNDMTNGYGPEEFLIRSAQTGVYEVLVDYFSSDFLNPNTPVVTQVEIFTNWGRPNQTRAVTRNEFTSDKQDEYSLAKIQFDGEKKDK